MDRLAKLRVVRGSSGLNDSSVSTTSLGTGAGYETANDDSLASSASMYFSANETEDLDQIEEPTLLDEEEVDDILTAAARSAKDASVQDHTLENDFSVEEVSTIRKVTIAQASPATVKVASGMAVKYLGVSSTPAAKPASPRGSNLSGVAPLEDKKDTPSILKKLRDPKTPECFSSEEDAEESKANLDSSAVPPAPNKSFGTNVLSNFFESLNVKGTPVPDAPPEIKVTPASEDKTPTNKRDSRRLETFFESLKKEPAQPPEEEKENKKTIRRSLIPTRAASAERLRPRTSLLGSATKQHRVASPIARPPRKSSLVKLIPDQLKEMRRANLVSVKPPGTRIVPPQIKPPPPGKEEIVGDSVRVNGLRKSLAVPSSSKIAVGPAVAALAAKRKSVVPAPVASRRSVLPAKVTRRTIAPVATAASTAPPPKVALKIPAKTTVSSSDVTTRRTSLGKRSISALNPSEKAEPSSKLRKSLAPVKEAAAPPQKPAPPPSRIRPPTTTSAAGTAFKKPETFSCEHCQRIFRLKSSYETHLKTVHQSGSSSTSSTSGGTGNKSTESVSTELKCQYCAKGFAGAKFLANHVVTNCVKIPPLEKRKLLAQDEQQRAALVTAAKRTPETRRLIRPPSVAAGSSGAGNRSNSSVRSGDETCSDTSTTSNPGQDKRKKRISTTVGHGGITRTPKKEIKCHLCARRFLNAVEYALHVQAHAKGAGGGEDKQESEVEAMTTEADSAGTKEATELVQKLAALRGRSKK